MSCAYYNENDLRAAAWLRELIAGGHIAYGYVDERSILDVAPSDLDGFTQCHFFAGIGGWSYALRLAGVADDAPIWTGSCPCQPFSAAGQGRGFADERHLWPYWLQLIHVRRPTIIFGEQVASALAWYDLVHADMEAEGYAVGAAIIGAHSVGAPHIRQRLYFVADADSSRREARQRNVQTTRYWEALASNRSASELGDSDRQPTGRHTGTIPSAQGSERELRSELDGPWSTVDWLPCRDGKYRPTKRGIHPLAHGVPDRVGLLRGYGNSIVPQAAAAFIEAYLEATS